MFFEDELGRALRARRPANARGYLVGVSGGADSAALLTALAGLREGQGAMSLRAVHIDHGLQAAAAEFAERCEQLCRQLQVPLTVLRLRIDPPPGRSIEECAREARYAALAAELGSAEVLLTAHHAEDQAETFLLQALRGAGTAGLAAMPALRVLGQGWHLRPLLAMSRAQIRHFLLRQQIEPVADAMNADVRFDRAYLRHRVWPTLEQRWPAIAEVLSRSAHWVAQAQRCCDALALTDLDAIRDGVAISARRLRRLTPPRQAAALRAFIDSSQCRAPSQARLSEALRQMQTARGDRMPAVYWSAHALRRYRDRIYLTPGKLPELGSFNWQWRMQPVCELGAGLGRLRMRSRVGGLEAARLPEVLQVRARVGGESLKPQAGAATQGVRHLFQQLGVVPWMRASIPYVFAGDSLLAIADLWTDARHRAAPGSSGLGLVWEDAPPVD